MMVTARALRCGSVPSIISLPRRSGPRLAFQRPQPRSRRTGAAAVADASTIQGLPEFLQNLKYDDKGLVAVIVQNVDSGGLAMQAFADQNALAETLQTGLATFYSRSRKGRWCKGETSGNFIKVLSIHYDCDRDSIIYVSEPTGPSCHTGTESCWYQAVSIENDEVVLTGKELSAESAPRTSLQELQYIIEQRKLQAADAKEGEKQSWTAKLLADEELLCRKIREEAGELCETIEKGEGRERTVSEAADLLYHSMVLLGREGVPLEEVAKELRRRFGQSGIAEKAARKQ